MDALTYSYTRQHFADGARSAGSGLTFDISSPTFRPFHRKALPSMLSV